MMRARERIENMKSGSGMFCIDWQEANLGPLKGHWRQDAAFTSIDIHAIPCQQRFTMANGTVVEPRDDCEQSKEAVKAYMGESVILVAYFNTQDF